MFWKSATIPRLQDSNAKPKKKGKKQTKTEKKKKPGQHKKPKEETEEDKEKARKKQEEIDRKAEEKKVADAHKKECRKAEQVHCLSRVCVASQVSIHLLVCTNSFHSIYTIPLVCYDAQYVIYLYL